MNTILKKFTQTMLGLLAITGLAGSACAAAAQPNPIAGQMSYGALESAAYARPAQPVIKSRTGDWKDSQIYDPIILANPADPEQLIMWVSGMYAPVASGEQCIGRFTASAKHPQQWVEHGGNPVSSGTRFFPWAPTT